MPQKKGERNVYAEIADAYQKASGETEFDLRSAVAWGIKQELLDATLDVIKWHADRMSEALNRGEHGERYWYAVKTQVKNAETEEFEQRTLWGHEASASDDFLIRALEQTLDQIRRDQLSALRRARRLVGQRPQTERRVTQLLLRFGLRLDESEAS